jgi:hypothetical protein
VLLGELNKYTTLSAQRFTLITPATGGGFDLTLAGAVGESVTVTALHQAGQDEGLVETQGGMAFKVVVKTVVIGPGGAAKMLFA